MQIAEDIKAARKAKGMTQEELSEGICTRTTLSRFESGRTNISTFTLSLIMERLELELKTK